MAGDAEEEIAGRQDGAGQVDGDEDEGPDRGEQQELGLGRRPAAEELAVVKVGDDEGGEDELDEDEELDDAEQDGVPLADEVVGRHGELERGGRWVRGGSDYARAGQTTVRSVGDVVGRMARR